MPGQGENDLQFQEIHRLVAAALTQRGFSEAASAQSAAIAVFVSAGIGNPTQETVSYIVPQLGLVPQGTTVTGTATTSGNSTTLSGTTTTRSRLGITGYGTATDTYTTYTRYLVVTAVDLAQYKATREAKEVWRTAVVSTGSSSDFRLVLPYLVVAASDYFGTMTDHIMEQSFRENDTRVVALKQLARTPAEATQEH